MLWQRLCVILILVFVATPGEAAPAWSSPVDGIRARLVAVGTVDASKRPQLELWLEIENVSDTDGGIPLSWGYLGTMVQLSLESDGKPVPTAPVAGSHASGPPYVVALPVGATLRVPISKTAYEHVSATKVMFRPFTFQSWELPQKRGKLVGGGKLSPHPPSKDTKPAPRAWTKPIDLPKLELP